MLSIEKQCTNLVKNLFFQHFLHNRHVDDYCVNTLEETAYCSKTIVTTKKGFGPNLYRSFHSTTFCATNFHIESIVLELSEEEFQIPNLKFKYSHIC